MAKRKKKKILAVVDDLMFTVKINDAARRAGMLVEFLKSNEDVLVKADEGPAVIILDLNAHSVDPLALIRELKADSRYKKISLIAYLSQVQGELKKQAHEAGCDIVMTRSAFSQNLRTILKRHADA